MFDVVLESTRTFTQAEFALGADWFRKNGVLEYWLVDKNARELVAFVSDERHYGKERVFAEGQRVTSRVLEGLEFDVAEVMRVGARSNPTGERTVVTDHYG
jgi:Uma2 family endonuclease